MYNPEWGRFINADSLGGQIGTILSHNVFAYCKNNPVNMSDPSGFMPTWAKWAIAAVVVVAVIAVVVVVAPEIIPAVVTLATDAYYAAGAAVTVASWRAANAVSNVIRGVSVSAATLEETGGGTGSAAINVTEKVVKNAIKDSPLKTQQPAVSLPKIQKYVERLANGEVPPAIKVDKGIIVDGNHRYIASRILGKEIGQMDWLGGRVNDAIDMIKLFIDPTDW